MNALTRDAVRDQLNIDERLEHGQAILELIEQAQLELAKLHRLAAGIPDDYPAPDTALALVRGLARNKRNQRPGAIVDQLVTEAFDRSIQLGRAHECTWDQLGEAAGEARSNLAARYTK